MPDNRIKIAFVDDHPLITKGLKTLLEKDDQLEIAGLFDSGEAFLQHIQNHEINVVLLDISLPDINGLELCKKVKSEAPKVIIIILSNHVERSIIMQAIQNGANGYLLKNTSLSQLRSSILHALYGSLVFSDEVNKLSANPLKNNCRAFLN